MKLNLFILPWILMAALSGCAYRGAYYAEHSQIGLDVRANANSTSGPIKGQVGYDHGIAAFVPRRDAAEKAKKEATGQGTVGSQSNHPSTEAVAHSTNASSTLANQAHLAKPAAKKTESGGDETGQPGPKIAKGSGGESVSVISWNYTGTQTGFDPLHPNKSALVMDAGFISGTAAVVAAAPKGSTVEVRNDDRTPTAVTGPMDSSAGERITAATQPRLAQAGYFSEWQKLYDTLYQEFSAKAKTDASLWSKLVVNVDDGALALLWAQFNGQLPNDPGGAYFAAANVYLQKDAGARYRKLISGLTATLAK